MSSAGEQRDVSLLWFVYLYLLYSLFRVGCITRLFLFFFCFFLRDYLSLVRCFFQQGAEDELLVGSFRTTGCSSQAGLLEEISSTVLSFVVFGYLHASSTGVVSVWSI